MVSVTDPSAAIHGLAGHSGLVDSAMELAANYAIFAVLLLVLVAWLRPGSGMRACVAAGLAGVVAVGASGLVGIVWDRPRPFIAGHFTPLISHAADASFPSDHVAALAAVAAALWFESRRLSAGVGVLAGVVGFARVYVGVHYLSDITGGVAVGLGCGVLAWRVTALFAAPLAALDALLIRARLRRRADANC